MFKKILLAASLFWAAGWALPAKAEENYSIVDAVMCQTLEQGMSVVNLMKGSTSVQEAALTINVESPDGPVCTTKVWVFSEQEFLPGAYPSPQGVWGLVRVTAIGTARVRLRFDEYGNVAFEADIEPFEHAQKGFAIVLLSELNLGQDS